eukprot:341201-Rhodomonas_salina.3
MTAGRLGHGNAQGTASSVLLPHHHDAHLVRSRAFFSVRGMVLTRPTLRPGSVRTGRTSAATATTPTSISWSVTDARAN